LGEITMDLRLVLTIPSGKLTINGLVLGLKEAAPQVLETMMTTLLEAIEEQAVLRQIEKGSSLFQVGKSNLSFPASK